MRCNLDELEPLHTLLCEHGVSVWQIQLASAMGNMAEQKALVLDRSVVPRLTRFIHDKRREGRVRVYAGDDVGYLDEHEAYLRSRPGTICVWGGCQAGLRVVGIDSAGNVRGCESMCSERFIEGNLRSESLAEIWLRPGAFAYNRQFHSGLLTGLCAGCDKGEHCRAGCRGSNWFSAGALFENHYCCYPGRVSHDVQPDEPPPL
jgi:radical SAM protein with 4Fe4S-binding SPASM domain